MEVVAFCLGGLMEKTCFFCRDFVAEMFCSSWNSFDFFFGRVGGRDGKIWKKVK